VSYKLPQKGPRLSPGCKHILEHIYTPETPFGDTILFVTIFPNVAQNSLLPWLRKFFDNSRRGHTVYAQKKIFKKCTN